MTTLSQLECALVAVSSIIRALEPAFAVLLWLAIVVGCGVAIRVARGGVEGLLYLIGA